MGNLIEYSVLKEYVNNQNFFFVFWGNGIGYRTRKGRIKCCDRTGLWRILYVKIFIDVSLRRELNANS